MKNAEEEKEMPESKSRVRRAIVIKDPFADSAMAKKEEKKKPKILIVDSNDKARGKAAKILRKGGYEVAEARTAKETLKIIRGKDVDLVLLETELEDGEAWNVLKLIESDWELREMKIPIAMFTEKSIPVEIAKRPDVERLVDYIVRPKKKKELLERINGIFEAFAKLDETAKKVRKQVSYGVSDEYRRISRALRLHLRLATALKEKLDGEREQSPEVVKELRNLLSNELRMIRHYKKRKSEIRGMIKE
jgi:response regulator RpfG family c-di-GMP phosphodiesterase